MKLPRNKYTWFFALAILLFLSGCKVQRPKGILPEGKMEEILYDYHIAKAMGENLASSDNYKRALYAEYVFQKHGTTEAAFDSSLVWYTRNTEVLSKMYDRVNKRLTAQQDIINNLVAIRDNKPKTSLPGDSIDVWLSKRLYYLTGYPLNNRMTFSLPSDTNFKERDSISWSVRYRFMDEERDTLASAIMALQVVYSNDSILSRTERVDRSGMNEIGLQSDTLGGIKEIRGFIYYQGREPYTTHLLADSIVLMRYHATDSIPVNQEEEPVIETPVQEEPVREVAPSAADTIQIQRLSPEEMRRRRIQRSPGQPERAN